MDNTNTYKAILLLGPTGTGKTPLGQQLETRNLWGKTYRHFDFGEKLREAAALSDGTAGKEGGGGVKLTKKELETINNVLKSNSLLEDGDFPIAEKLLSAFIGESAAPAGPETEIIILNGLPRHTGQAEALSRIVDIRLVIILEAHPAVIIERIKSNSGGDRAGRKDDSQDEISRKLDIYRQQTMPLVEYYKKLDRTILEIEVETDTIPLYIIQGLETMPDLL